MDFSKFRSSGDLSDITVKVGEREFNLHRFPLFAKSDYFCSMARTLMYEGASPPHATVVDLVDFPGGADSYNEVANFCYNLDVDITKDNAVQLLCAAEYLQMTGIGNLKELAERFLEDILASAKMSRSVSTVMSILASCCSLGEIAERTGLITKCIDTLVKCWLRSNSRFAAPSIGSNGGSPAADNHTLAIMNSLPVEWVAMILDAGREHAVSAWTLTDIAQRYISEAMEQNDVIPEDKQEGEVTANGITDGNRNNDNEVKTPTHDFDLLKETKKPKLKTVEDIGHILDTILLKIPSSASLTDHVTAEWITKALRIATAKRCQCKSLLVRSASHVLTRLSSDDLCSVTPSLIHDIMVEPPVSEAERESDLEAYSNLADTYMLEMSKKGQLSTETFRRLTAALPTSARTSHDQLFTIVENIMDSDLKPETPEDRQELLSVLDFDLLSECSLQKIYARELAPMTQVTKAALSLCTKLRAQLDNFKRQMEKKSNKPYVTSVPSVLTSSDDSRRALEQSTELKLDLDAISSRLRDLPTSVTSASSQRLSTHRDKSMFLRESRDNRRPLMNLYVPTSGYRASRTTTYDKLPARSRLSHSRSPYRYRPINIEPPLEYDSYNEMDDISTFRSLDSLGIRPYTSYDYKNY